MTNFTVNKKSKCISSGIFHLKVPESSPVGSAIGRIRAVDPDFGQNAEIEYNIVPGDGGNLFDIVTDEDTQEGVIKLKKVRGHVFEKQITQSKLNNTKEMRDILISFQLGIF